MKFIPYEKLSKKKRRELDLARRNGWGDLNPVTRVQKSQRAYKRERMRLSEDGEALFFCSMPCSLQKSARK